MAPPKELKPGPVTRVCHVCGRQYGLSSFEIHLKQCKKLWTAQEELKPKSERRPVPRTPPGIGQMAAAEVAVGGGGAATREAIEALNRVAQESFNEHGMEKCENCGRTFAEGRLAIHLRSCRPGAVAKKVGDGAAPRNKRDTGVEYGRAKHSDSADDDYSLSPMEQSVSRSALTTPNSTSTPQKSSPEAPRALSGNFASNRKRVPATSSRPQIQSPIVDSVPTDAAAANHLREELSSQGSDSSMIELIQSKLSQWEAKTLATLQEIRDLQQLFAQMKA